MVRQTGKFEVLVRVGYFSRAVLYMVLGSLALSSAERMAEGTDGIFRTVGKLPGGTLLLWILVVGLFAYALFRIASPLFDIEHEGSDATGWARRIGHAGSAVGHLALAWTAWGFATGAPSGGGDNASDAAAGVLSVAFGNVVIGLLGLAFFAAGLAQAQKGISGRFMQRISSAAPDSTRWLGGAGYLARAIVFAIVGWSLFETGFLAKGSANVKTLGEAVASLADQGWIFTLVAAGLLLFGVFSLVLARYRIIPDFDPSRRVPTFRA